VPSLLAVEILVFIHWESGLMILLGTFAIWLGGRTLIAVLVVLVVPFSVVLDIVDGTTI
jgi:hypothetical protein